MAAQPNAARGQNLSPREPPSRKIGLRQVVLFENMQTILWANFEKRVYGRSRIRGASPGLSSLLELYREPHFRSPAKGETSHALSLRRTRTILVLATPIHIHMHGQNQWHARSGTRSLRPRPMVLPASSWLLLFSYVLYIIRPTQGLEITKIEMRHLLYEGRIRQASRIYKRERTTPRSILSWRWVSKPWGHN